MNEKVRYLADGVEYYPESNELLLVRCPKCDNENYAPSVASGICIWCGFNGWDLLKKGGEP